ncbi:putative ATP diphosphatase [Dioscorea sansibarensis]
MPPLKNLEAEFPIIDANFRRFCASNGIFSVEDFLVHDIYALTAFADSEANAEVLKQGIAQVHSIIDKLHQPWLNGLELLEDVNQYKHFLSTGCEGIDKLLGGGLRQGQLTEIVGPSSSGKTQVCLCTALHVADKNLGTVMYLDTCNSFSPKRIAAMISQYSNDFITEGKEGRLNKIMRSIICRSVFDIFELLGVLNELASASEHQVKNRGTRLCLLIIDSISFLITPILGGKDSQGRMLMLSCGTLLKKLANEHNISVLVTNHMVRGEGGVLKPALGESWKSIPHVRLQLSCDRVRNICQATVLKHTFMASGCSWGICHP